MSPSTRGGRDHPARCLAPGPCGRVHRRPGPQWRGQIHTAVGAGGTAEARCRPGDAGRKAPVAAVGPATGAAPGLSAAEPAAGMAADGGAAGGAGPDAAAAGDRRLAGKLCAGHHAARWNCAISRQDAIRRRPRLSGGEFARAMLARAIVSEPQILIVDEPITGLDPDHAMQSMQLLKDFARRRHAGDRCAPRPDAWPRVMPAGSS